MPFRDRTPTCPRCKVDMARSGDEREAWDCPRCSGVALGIGDLIDDLLDVAPHLRPTDGVRDLVTVSRRASANLQCPACGRVMEPVYLAAVEIERCREDNLVWLDRGERDAIVARAKTQRRSRLLDHLRAVLADHPHAASTRASRITSIISSLAILAAVPTGLFGALLLSLDESSMFGVAAGLIGLMTLGGMLLVLIAAIMLIVGGIVFVRHAC